ncbi:MAG: preprotein translocase subunit SecG [Bdellovibrionales bacterium]
MENVVLIIHLIIAVALVGLILLQRSEGGGLVGGGGNMGAVAPRAQADVLTKTTGFLATCFIITSLLLVILANNRTESSLIDQMAAETPAPAAEAPVEPALPVVPAVPLAQ